MPIDYIPKNAPSIIFHSLFIPHKKKKLTTVCDSNTSMELLRVHLCNNLSSLSDSKFPLNVHNFSYCINNNSNNNIDIINLLYINIIVIITVKKTITKTIVA